MQRDRRTFVRDLRQRRLALGISQATSRRRRASRGRSSAGSSVTSWARPTSDDVAAIAAVLGLGPAHRRYPEGQPDRRPCPAPPARRIPGEAPSRRSLASRGSPPDRRGPARLGRGRACADDDRAGIEGISRFGAVDATSGASSRSSATTRAIRRWCSSSRTPSGTGSRSRPPAPSPTRSRSTTRCLMRALGAAGSEAQRDRAVARAAGRVTERSGAGRPHDVHNGGKVVDGRVADSAKFVDKPVGAPGHGP